MDKHGFNYITKDEWLANSPEFSPMDYFANGCLKNKLKKRKYRTISGMIAAASDEWSKIPLEMFRKALDVWSDRVLKIHKAHGQYVPI